MKGLEQSGLQKSVVLVAVLGSDGTPVDSGDKDNAVQVLELPPEFESGTTDSDEVDQLLMSEGRHIVIEDDRPSRNHQEPDGNDGGQFTITAVTTRQVSGDGRGFS